MNTASSTLEERLFSLGIRRILVADDSNLNREAAKQAVRNWSLIRQGFFASELDIRSELTGEKHSGTVVFTDMAMISVTAGLEVMKTALRHDVPCLIVTSGTLLGGTPCTRLIPGFMEGRRTIVGEKSSPETWHKIFGNFVDETTSRTGIMWPNLMRNMREGRPFETEIVHVASQLALEDFSCLHRPTEVTISSFR